MSIRLATTDDAAAIAAIYEPFVTGSRITFEEEAPDVGEMACSADVHAKREIVAPRVAAKREATHRPVAAQGPSDASEQLHHCEKITS